jgi:CHC2-type zinc finger protein
MISKPSILEVVSQRIELRRVGRWWRGLCPFHAEKTASFFVNEDKGFFHCFGCQAKGDVIDFIQRLDGLGFRDACKVLGIDNTGQRPARRLTPSRKRAATLAATWVNDQRAKFNVMIAEAMERRDLADETSDFELAESFDRELIILRAFDDSLNSPRGAAELLGVRQSIEEITDGAEVVYDPPPPFPACTPEYRAELQKNPLAFERVVIK